MIKGPGSGCVEKPGFEAPIVQQIPESSARTGPLKNSVKPPNSNDVNLSIVYS